MCNVNWPQRFWKYVDKTSSPVGCWLWTGHVANRYGVTWFNMKNKRAHRASWELANNCEIPQGMSVLHKCDNPLCVNPDHLSLGSHIQNMQDMVSKSRNPKMEKSGRAKLTATQVKEIRERYAKGEKPTPLSIEFGVSQENVSNIVARRSWREI